MPYGIIYHMKKAELLFRAKKIYPDMAVKEMVIWKLPEGSHERPHGLKYRLYYGTGDGKSLVRYDNEKGKGDHRHYMGEEEPYHFQGVEKLVADFQSDINRLRGETDEKD